MMTATYYYAGFLSVGLFLAMLVALELGFRIGRRQSVSDRTVPALGVVQGALLGTVALLLGFTFALASERYDSRRILLAEETNELGIAYLRTTFMSQENGRETRRIFRDYLKERITWLHASDDPEKVEASTQRLRELRLELWWRVQKEATEDPGNEMIALLVEALNECTDLASLQAAARKARVPLSVLGLVVASALLSATSIGYGFGVSRERVFAVWFGFAALVAATVYTIVNFDRPDRGLIRVSTEMLEELHERIVRSVDREAAQHAPK